MRGEDLLDSTPRQKFLQQMLGYATPRYLHIPVVLGPDGQKLSKQNGAAPLNRNRAVPLLLDALRFLGHQPPAQASIDEIWYWTIYDNNR